MRISDWSSDVCSSDLGGFSVHFSLPGDEGAEPGRGCQRRCGAPKTAACDCRYGCRGKSGAKIFARRGGDRKSVVKGTSVSVRVVLGGAPIINTKKNTT